MPTRQFSQVLRHLRRAGGLPDRDQFTDGQLLERFISHRDEGAFAALVRRHGPMVWGVCRRILHDHHHAEDAFQATFLVLVRRAAAVWPREAVGHWLYGVAYQTSLKARATAAKRRAREKQGTAMPEPAAPERDLWHDLQPLLDRELSRLPAKYRVPLVLCDLEGRPRKEVARQLGWPEGTLSGRLARARQALAKRLTQRGVTVSGAALAAALAGDAASAKLPSSVILDVASQAATVGALSVPVIALTEGVVKDMLFTKLISAAAVLLAVGLLALGAGLLSVPTAAGQADDKPANGKAARTPQTDKEKLQGVWKVVTMESDGKPQKLVEAMLLVAGNRACLQTTGNEMHYGLYLDPTARPKAFDLITGERTLEGIYALDGDTLRLCYDLEEEAKRPRRFATQPGSGQLMMVLKRQKEFGTDFSYHRRPDGSKVTFPTLVQKKDQVPPPPPRVLEAPVPPVGYGEPNDLRTQVKNLERRVAALEAKLQSTSDASKKQPARVGQIIIVGNEKTPDAVIRKKLGIIPGQVLDYQALRAAEKRLTEFDLAVVTVVGGEGSGFRDILVTVREK